MTGTFEALNDFIPAFDIEILRSLKKRCSAPRKPRVGHGASGAGSLGAFRCASEHSTAPIAVKR